MRRIAVYGSLRKGHYNYREAQGEPIATGHITNAALYSLGAYPCIVATDNPDDKVVVEVYDLDDNLFDRIDLMEIGAGYKRLPVTVHTNDGTADLPIEAEAYFYPKVMDWFADARVASGNWNHIHHGRF